MKSVGPVRLVVVLLTIAWVSSMPAKESTTRRYNFHVGHNTTNKTRLGISGTKTNQLHTNSLNNKLITTPRTSPTTTKYLSRSSKFFDPLLKIFPETTTNKLLPLNFVRKPEVIATKTPQVIKPKIGVIKVSQVSKSSNRKKPQRQPLNDTNTINNFIQSTFEDLNTPNKTIKIVRVSSTPLKRIQKPVSNKRVSTTIRPLKQRIKTTQRPKNKTNKLSIQPNLRVKESKPTTARPLAYITKENKNWPDTNIKNPEDLNRYKNYTQLPVRTKKKKPKPTVYKVISKWSDKPPYSAFKQSWYDHGIPVPSPNPEISTYSPQNSISSAVPADLDYDGDVSISQVPSSHLGNPISQVALDIRPNAQNVDTYSTNGQNSNCPTVHLTSSVFGPSAKQECVDLNLAINTHINQNTITERLPVAVESDPLDEEASSAVAEPDTIGAPETVAADSAIAADPGIAADPPAAAAADAAPAAADGGGAAGAPGGGFPGLPSLPGLPNPLHLGHLLRLLGHALRLFGFLGNAFQILKGILAYLGPLAWILSLLSFGTGFLSILLFYPWWLPFLFLFAKKKEPPPPEIVLHHHAHKPVHHYDGWFWNHNTKTWSNVFDYAHGRSSNNGVTNQLSVIIMRLIEDFSRKYKNESQKSQSWKRRKK